MTYPTDETGTTVGKRKGSMMNKFVALAASIVAGAALGAELPPLVGDGVADDTAAIQARLDVGLSCVYLPPPKDHYVISKTLKIGSGQELRLDRLTRIRLAEKSDCPLLENRCYRAGSGTNTYIVVTGGIWDMDNLHQTPNNLQTKEGRAKRPKVHTPEYFFGMAMRFCHVEGLTVQGLTIRNPTTYGIAFCHVSDFLVNDIAFDYKTWNPIPLNMDGVHFDGFCHHGKVSNLRGTCFDDMVALNANDVICAPEEGPISDIDIDGIYADYCHSAVRLLSAGADLKRVTVRNVHGHFYCYTVGLTHYFSDKPRGRFDDIVIEDVFAAKALVPPECGGQEHRGPMEIVLLQGPIDVGNLTVSRLHRDESCLPTATIGIDSQSAVENLTVRDCRMVNRLDKPIKFLVNRGRIDNVITNNIVFRGKWED